MRPLGFQFWIINNITDQLKLVFSLLQPFAEGEYFPKLFEQQVPERYHSKAKLEIEKLALTKPQIEEWKLPWIWIPKPRLEHMRKKYVSDYWKQNKQQKVELDAISDVTLTNLIEKRLRKILDWSVVEKSDIRSKLAVTKWKQQHGLDEN